jgi:hypothetical protein
MLGDDLGRYVAATRPALVHSTPGETPLEWTPERWRREVEVTEGTTLLDTEAIDQQFDRDAFLRDGVVIFQGVMTEDGRRRWTAAAREAQALNDRLIHAAPAWATGIDWEALGRADGPPERTLTADEIEAAVGTSQSIAQADDTAGVRTLRQNSVIAEYFPAGHVPELMRILLHPQMLALQRRLLGCEDVRFDHNQLLNRRPGYPGGAWHSHKIGGGCDEAGVCTDLAEYDAQPNLSLCLCYPEGFGGSDDGGLGVIRGSHLFRDTEGLRAGVDLERGLTADDVRRALPCPLPAQQRNCLAFGGLGAELSTTWRVCGCLKL